MYLVNKGDSESDTVYATEHSIAQSTDMMMQQKMIYHVQQGTAPEWCSGLRHCISVLEVSLQTLVQSRAVPQPAVIGSPIGWCTIGPA